MKRLLFFPIISREREREKKLGVNRRLKTEYPFVKKEKRKQSTLLSKKKGKQSTLFFIINYIEFTRSLSLIARLSTDISIELAQGYE